MLKRLLVIVLVSLGVLLLGSILYSVFQPRPYDWYPSYNRFSKHPYGTYIFHRLLPGFFPDHLVRQLDMVKRNDLDYSDYLDEDFWQDSLNSAGEYVLPPDSLAFLREVAFPPDPANIFFIGQTMMADPEAVRLLLLHLYQGNQALIVVERPSPLLARLLDIEYRTYRFMEDTMAITNLPMSFEENPDSLVYDSLKQYTIRLDDGTETAFKPFTYIDVIEHYPRQARVIARNASGAVVGLEIPVGKGRLILFSLPVLFTNYYLLNEDPSLVEKLVLRLPERDTYFTSSLFVYHKPEFTDRPSILSFIHSEPALRWAFYTLLAGVLLYFLLQLRRVERPVPEIKPPRNLSLDFIRQVSALFFMYQDNKELVKKKMDYFLDFVRHRYHLHTHTTDERFFDLLARKSGVKKALLEHIFKLYSQYMQQKTVNNDEFLRFNKLMQTFKDKN